MDVMNRNKQEIEDCLQRFIVHFCCKYYSLSKYIDVEQYVIDAVYGAYLRADYSKPEKELYSFFDKRIRYYMINGLRRTTKNNKMLSRYLDMLKHTVLEVQKNNDVLYIEMLLDDINRVIKYNVLPSLLGSVPVRQLAKINGISTGAMRRWVLKAKDFVRCYLD